MDKYLKIVEEKGKQLFHYFLEKIFMDQLFLDLGIFFIFTGWADGWQALFLIYLIFIGIKIYYGEFINTLFSYQLFRHGEYKHFTVLGTMNIVFFAILFIFFAPLWWADSFLILFYMLCFRIFLAWEYAYIQKIFAMEIINGGLYGYELTLPNSMTTPYLVSLHEKMEEFDRRKEELIEEGLKTEKLKTDLITNISHDLKTPLTSIVNYGDLLSKKEELDEEAREYIGVLKRNSTRLKSLIIDMIFASRTGSGDLHMEKSLMEFNELLLQIYGDFDQLFKQKNLDFVYSSKEEEILVYTDVNLLVRVIENLMSNAYKYSKEGTRVYGEVFQEDQQIIFEMKNVSKEPLNISVDELYRQLVKVDKSRHTEGSGLGLYIATNLVEALGGRMIIQIDGDYFKVRIQLPKDEEEQWKKN